MKVDKLFSNSTKGLGVGEVKELAKQELAKRDAPEAIVYIESCTVTTRVILRHGEQ